MEDMALLLLGIRVRYCKYTFGIKNEIDLVMDGYSDQ